MSINAELTPCCILYDWTARVPLTTGGESVIRDHPIVQMGILRHRGSKLGAFETGT